VTTVLNVTVASDRVSRSHIPHRTAPQRGVPHFSLLHCIFYTPRKHTHRRCVPYSPHSSSAGSSHTRTPTHNHAHKHTRYTTLQPTVCIAYTHTRIYAHTHCVYTMHTALRTRQKRPLTVTHCNTLQHTATRCHMLPKSTTHCYTLPHAATRCNMLPHAATHTLQHAAIHYHTLQHAVTHCNTLIYAATRRHTRPKEDQNSTAARI